MAKRKEQAELIASVCRKIEAAGADLPLKDLAAQAGLSVYHFHRLFKEFTGLTPKAYGQARRAEVLRQQLQQGSVTSAIFAAGYGSSSRFYEKADNILGMTATDFQAGGADSTIYFAIAQCSLGAILVAQSLRGVCAILLGDDPQALLEDLQKRFARAHLLGGDERFEEVVAAVVGLVERPALGLDLPLDIRGTAFQQRVWQALREIPVGKTVSYGEIAEKIGAPRAVRAVASACGANALAVAIPCHRVVRSDGALSGYRWGLERKRELLKREQPD